MQLLGVRDLVFLQPCFIKSQHRKNNYAGRCGLAETGTRNAILGPEMRTLRDSILYGADSTTAAVSILLLMNAFDSPLLQNRNLCGAFHAPPPDAAQSLHNLSTNQLRSETCTYIPASASKPVNFFPPSDATAAACRLNRLRALAGTTESSPWGTVPLSLSPTKTFISIFFNAMSRLVRNDETSSFFRHQVRTRPLKNRFSTTSRARRTCGST